MNQAVYNTISGSSLLNNYKVHYYFDKYLAAANPYAPYDPYVGSETSYYIYSDATAQYSGEIVSYASGAPSADALDVFTGDLGTGTFSGGAYQVYDYVTIQNSEDLFSGEFTFLIAAETTSRQDIGEDQKGPLSNNNILFSNLNGQGFNYSGWQLGINAANRAYVEMYDDLSPIVLTYMGKKPPYTQNIWGFVANEGSIKVGLYDIDTQTFSFNSRGNNSGTLNSLNEWKIGSGINFDPNTTFSPHLTLNSGVFAGKMTNFLYFNKDINDDQLNPIARSLYSSLYEKAQPTYSSGIRNYNYETTSGFVSSGVVGQSGHCSTTGYITGTVDFEERVEVTGDVPVGSTYYLVFSEAPHPISGVVKEYRALYNNGAVLTGITGFSIVPHQTGIVTPVTGCSGVDVSGLIASGSGASGSGIGGFTGLLTSGVSGLVGEPSTGLGPNAFSYIGAPLGNQGVVEQYSVAGIGTLNRGSLNNLASVGKASLKEGRGFFIKKASISGSVGLYLNGIAREIGGISLKTPGVSKVFYNEDLNKTFAQLPNGQILDRDKATSQQIQELFNEYNVIRGDAYISGLEVLESLVFNSPVNIFEIYDTGLDAAAARSRWAVTSTSDYESPPDPNPIIGDQWVFFNGQKLASGINYYIDDAGYGNGFTPSGYITGITGLYFTLPGVEGATRTTGTSLSFDGPSFFPNSEIIFINGVRQDVSIYYVEHSKSKDLISGQETLENYGTSLYNNYN